MRGALLVVGLGVLVASCVTPTATTCDDGFVCGAGLVCAPSGAGCVAPGQLCDLAEGAPCEFQTLDGVCVGGVCDIGGCGNAEINAGEACDDGNTTSGDGCRADCGKVEVCGDALVDTGEACDDGNANPADGCDACARTAWQASALLAGARDALAIGLYYPLGVTVARDGDVYIADTSNNRIRRVSATTGIATTVAGTGVYGTTGDGGPATAARLSTPRSLVVDGLGNLTFTEGRQIRRVDASTGRLTTIAGTGAVGNTGDGGPATSATFGTPAGLVADGLGNVYVSDSEAHVVRRIDAATGVITRVAGTGVNGLSSDGIPALDAELDGPFGLALDGDALYVAEINNHRVRRVALATGLITTLAGTGISGDSGDGGDAATAEFASPYGVALDGAGGLYVADHDSGRVRRVDLDAGTIAAAIGAGGYGFGGDGGPALTAVLAQPGGVAVGRDGRVLIADTSNQRVRVVAVDGTISTFAGTGTEREPGEGVAATAAILHQPAGLATDAGGAIFIADVGSFRIRRVDATTGLITTVAGTGSYGGGGDGGPATSAALGFARGVAIDADGALYIADTSNHRVRRVDPATGIITTVAGDGTPGSSGDGGPATTARLDQPSGVAVAANGDLYVVDTNGHRIRVVDATTHTISTVAGDGTPGYGGDGGQAVAAQLGWPEAVALDGAGRLLIADSTNHAIRRVDLATGVIVTIAGDGTAGFAGDGGPPGAARLNYPTQLLVDPTGAILIADTDNSRIRRIDPALTTITTIAGAGFGYNGDGGQATTATMAAPRGLAIAPAGGVYLVDGIHEVVRVLRDGIITAVAGALDPPGTGPLPLAVLADPQALVRGASFTLVAGGSAGVVQAIRAGGDALETWIGRYPQNGPTGDLARYRDGGFGEVGGVAIDEAAGLIYLTETSTDRLHVVSMVDPDDPRTWHIATVGAGIAGFADGALASARFRAPRGLRLESSTHTLYVADSGNHVIRAIDLTAQTVTTIAGTPATRGYFGDDLTATAALLDGPTALTLAPGGDIFVADTGNQRVRRIAAGTGIITTVLGDGVAASSGEGAPASAFPINAPRGLTTDARGNLYVTSSTAIRLLPADGDGVIDGTGAVLTIYGAAPRDSFPATATSCLTDVVVIDDMTVNVTDACSGLLIELVRGVVEPAP